MGATAFRPSSGLIPQEGVLQVGFERGGVGGRLGWSGCMGLKTKILPLSTTDPPTKVAATLDKTGIFCRQALDCAAVARALYAPSCPPASAGAAPRASGSLPHDSSQRRPPSIVPFSTSEGFRATLAANLSSICVGYLSGTSPSLVAALQRQVSHGRLRCVLGPLPAPPEGAAVSEDVLTVILEAEVAVAFDGLWRAGLVAPGSRCVGRRLGLNWLPGGWASVRGVGLCACTLKPTNPQTSKFATRWYSMLRLGQATPALAYLESQRLRQQLLISTRAYFETHGVSVIAKPGRSPGARGLDGLPALLGLPEVTLPVRFEDLGPAADDGGSNNGSSFNGSSVGGGGSNRRLLQDQQEGAPHAAGGGGDGGGVGAPALTMPTDSGSRGQSKLTRPEVDCLFGLPGGDDAVVAVADLFQRDTGYHLRRPPLAGGGAGAGVGGGAVAAEGG